MLSVNSISKSYGIEPILAEISFDLNPGERVGLVGPNGGGKTTLLRILVGEEQADSGSIQLNPTGLRIGYLPQGLSSDPDDTIAAYLDRVSGDLSGLSQKVETLARELAKSPSNLQLQRDYDQILSAIQAASTGSAQRAPILAALDLDHFDETTPLNHLSGGQKTRLALAGVLLLAPQLFFLDEPTNHLDIEMLEWLETWLVDSTFTRRCAALIVSHDRVFLDRTVTEILEIDPSTHRMSSYPGNYSDYLEQKLQQRERHQQAYADQIEEITRLRRAAQKVREKARFKRGGKGDSGDKFAKGFFADRSKEHIGRAKQIEQRLEKLQTEQKIEKPRQSWQMKLDFTKIPESSRRVLVCEDLIAGYDSAPVLSIPQFALHFGERMALIGPNGTGKTTLLHTIAGKIPPLGGTFRLGSSVRLGVMSQEQDTLDPSANPYQTIQRETPLSETEARLFLHQYLFSGDDVFIPNERLSFGERARLMLACLVASGCNLLLLDEPINHLDIPSRSRFEKALAGFSGTVIAVSHDRYFIHGFATQIWEANHGTLREVMAARI